MRKKSYQYHRGPRTLQERKANQGKWGRGRRNPYHLDPWGALERGYETTKSWKDKRKTQYRESGRRSEREHKIVIEDRKDKWILTDYFDEHDIPYRVIMKKQRELRKNITRYITLYQEPIREERLKYSSIKSYSGLCNGRTEFFCYECELNLPTIRYYYVTVDTKYHITWWSDKDIGLEYILNG